MAKKILWTALCILVVSVGWSAAEVPVTVSPAEDGGVPLVADRCPTFSWGSVEGANAYELAVLEAPGKAAPNKLATGSETLRAVIVQAIPAPATSWTPSLDRCLRPGGTYAWAVREKGEYGRSDGEWSEWTIFEIAAASSGEPNGSSVQTGGKASNGTGGIPAVQAQLDDIQVQMAANQRTLEELINRRLDTVEANLFACTPERLAAGKCDDNNPLNIEISICGDLGAQASLTGAFAIDNATHLEIGAGWTLLADLKADASVDLPSVFVTPTTPPLIFPIPKAELAAQGAAGLKIQGCLSGLTIPLSEVATSSQMDSLIAAMEAGGEELRSVAGEVIENIKLTPHQIAQALHGLQDLQDPTLPIQDRLVFSKGPLRDLVDTLPVGGRVQEVLDDPGMLVSDLSSVVGSKNRCNKLKNKLGLPELDPFFKEICPVADQLDPQILLDAFDSIADIVNQTDNIKEVTDKIKDVVDKIKDIVKPPN